MNKNHIEHLEDNHLHTLAVDTHEPAEQVRWEAFLEEVQQRTRLDSLDGDRAAGNPNPDPTCLDELYSQFRRAWSAEAAADIINRRIADRDSDYYGYMNSTIHLTSVMNYDSVKFGEQNAVLFRAPHGKRVGMNLIYPMHRASQMEAALKQISRLAETFTTDPGEQWNLRMALKEIADKAQDRQEAYQVPVHVENVPCPTTAADEGDQECSNPDGHEWVHTGLAYGGNDESYGGEGRCYCVYCGADGDA